LCQTVSGKLRCEIDRFGCQTVGLTRELFNCSRKKLQRVHSQKTLATVQIAAVLRARLAGRMI